MCKESPNYTTNLQAKKSWQIVSSIEHFFGSRQFICMGINFAVQMLNKNVSFDALPIGLNAIIFLCECLKILNGFNLNK